MFKLLFIFTLFIIYTLKLCNSEDWLEPGHFYIINALRENARQSFCLTESCIDKYLLEILLALEDFNVTALSIDRECIEDLEPIFQYISNRSDVPEDFVSNGLLPMFDASGKIFPNVLKSANIFWGYYPECKNISYQFPDRNRTWQMEYGRSWFSRELKDGKDPENCNNTWGNLGSWDFCLPKSCSSHDVLVLLQSITLEATNSTPFCSTKLISEVPQDMDYRTWIVWIVMGTITVICVLSCFIDYFVLQHDSMRRKNKYVKMLMCFSFYTNITEILSAGKPKPGQIGTLHCIRFFSICWVIMGHCHLAMIGLIDNTMDLGEQVQHIMGMFILNSFFSVDSFFFISGVLLTFLWFKEYKKNPKSVMNFNAWIMFYVHRIIRLSPPYYITLAFFTYVYPTLLHNMPLYLENDPLRTRMKSEPCQQHVWVNFLYLNNFVHRVPMCFEVGWYLATDTQMYIFTPFLIIPLTMHKIFGLVVAGFLLFASTAANIFTVYKNHYPANQIVIGYYDKDIKHADEYRPLMYAAPWIRCQVYIIGMLVGYFLQFRPTMKINKILNSIFWTLSFAILLFVILCLHQYFQGHALSLFGRAMYSAFSKPLWAISLSWIVIACYYGYGGPINKFMSWNIWVPLSRLTYCVYLIHFIVLYITLGFTQSPLIYSNFLHLYCTVFLPVTILSFLLAIIWSAAFELPFSKLETLLLQFKKNEKAQTYRI